MSEALLVIVTLVAGGFALVARSKVRDLEADKEALMFAESERRQHWAKERNNLIFAIEQRDKEIESLKDVIIDEPENLIIVRDRLNVIIERQ